MGLLQVVLPIEAVLISTSKEFTESADLPAWNSRAVGHKLKKPGHFLKQGG